MPLHRLLLLLLLSAALAGCPQKATEGEAMATPVAADTTPIAPVPEPAPAPEPIVATPPPAEAPKPVAPDPGPAPGQVDASCQVDADCAIKDVGSCCGYRPACVNVDSPTFPKEVQAKCEKEGRMSICGFPAISGCRCVEGRCAGTSAGDGGSAVQ